MREKDYWKEKIANALNKVLAEQGIGQTAAADDPACEIPPNSELGDLAFPMFSFAKLLKKAPALIAKEISAAVVIDDDASVNAAGPYINVKYDRAKTAQSILEETACLAQGIGAARSVPQPHAKRAAGEWSDSGTAESPTPRLRGGAPKRIMVEFSSPNTNKPLHLGHLRNDIIGESVSRILKACGAEVQKVCIINDRGIHICKSMLAYKEQGAGARPESTGVKSDHFVGDYYVCFNDMLRADTEALPRAQDLLVKWEEGDKDARELWALMNKWALDGIMQTYRRTGVSFDKYYFESETYLLGKAEVLRGLDKGLWKKEADGSVQVDLSMFGIGDKKILLRSDGTSLYVTQDIGTALLRYADWPFDKLIYVVGNEQRHHFKVLFAIFKLMGIEWADNLYHLSYGMVNLPEGKMKSREGTVVDADDLIDELRDMAKNEILSKGREALVGDIDDTAEKIAIGALHYFLLQVSPDKDMIFNPKESLQFNGNTGPYLQYMGARIESILRAGRAGTGDWGLGTGEARSDNLELKQAAAGSSNISNQNTPSPKSQVPSPHPDEWELLKTLGNFRDVVESAGRDLNPSYITAYLYELSKNFSRFYHNCPVLNSGDDALTRYRLDLCLAVRTVLKQAFDLVCIPFLESM